MGFFVTQPLMAGLWKIQSTLRALAHFFILAVSAKRQEGAIKSIVCHVIPIVK